MGLRSAASPGDESTTALLAAWFRRQPGSLLAEVERHLLAGILPDLFGFHLVQLGCHHRGDLLDSSRISHRLRVELGARAGAEADLLCTEEALPLAADTVDVLLLPHVLEFADDPRRVLREAQRVLIGEGHLVIVGFSPLSAFGACALLRRWQRRAPWTAHPFTAARVRDWLELLDFEVLRIVRGGYRPPLAHARLNERLAFLERLGAWCWPPLSNVFVIVARKRVEGITPLKVSWKQRRRLVAGGVAEPSARTAHGRGSGRGC